MGDRGNRRQECSVVGRDQICDAEEDWDLDETDAAKVLSKKKNWSAPGPDRLANVWWKRAHSLHKGVATALQAISRSDEEYPQWFSEGKTSLIPKPGKFSSDDQRPITCLNTIYKWYTSCLLVPTDKHLNHYELMEGAQRVRVLDAVGLCHTRLPQEKA